MRKPAGIVVAVVLLAAAAPSSSSAALARLHAGQRIAPTLKARELAKIGYAVVPDPEHAVHAELTPNDPNYAGSAWPYMLTRFPDAWSRTLGSSSIVIAVVDTGVNANPDLGAALLSGYDFVDGDTDTSDPNGHGSDVALLAAARTNNGVAGVGACGACSILPVRVLAADGTGTAANVAAGIVYAADHGARIINLSLGGPSDPAEQAAVAYAEGKGVLVVAAAGNSSGIGPAYPAAYPGVVSVEASNTNDNPYSWSNFGPSVALAAPGCFVLYGCGTSFASPLVSGAAGLYATLNPSATGAQIASALESSADRQTDTQYGRLDAGNLLGVALPGAPAQLPPVTVPTPAPTVQAPPAATGPILLGAPTVTGAALVGQTLSSTHGTWINAASVSYQWLRCARGDCTPISGATQPNYVVAQADVGSWLEVRVTATSSAGTTVATSSGTNAVPPAAKARPRRRR
jgi:hypothetical protein